MVDALAPLAEALDGASGGYVAALAAQREKFDDPDRTPSARVLAGVRETGSYFEYTMRRSREQHAAILAETPDPVLEAELAAGVAGSIEARAVLEARSEGTFEDFLADYFAQLPPRARTTGSVAEADA